MNTQDLNTLEQEFEGNLKHWWIFLILGVLSIGIGVWLFFTPLDGYVALTYLFAASFLLAGAASVVFTLLNRASIPAWGWNLASGLVVLALGVLLLINPAFTADVLAFYVAFALLFGGINVISYTLSLKRVNAAGWGWSLAFGILVILFAILLLFNPLFTAFSLVIWSALGFLILGASFCLLAFRLSKSKGVVKRRLNQEL